MLLLATLLRNMVQQYVSPEESLCLSTAIRNSSGVPECCRKDFPRTIQSAACVLLGFGCTVSTTGSTETSSLATVRVRGPKDQTLLPNYDGRCSRFAQGREAARSKAKATHLKEMRHRLETLLLPVIGEDPLTLDCILKRYLTLSG